MAATKPILTITGSDSTSESGIQADIKTILELGGYAVTAITSVTVQTTLGIQEIYDLPAEIVKEQIEAVMNDMQPDVVKVGMIRTEEVLDVVVDELRRYKPRHIIFDPIIRSSRGDALMTDHMLNCIVDKLMPLVTQVVSLDAVKYHGMKNRYASALAVFLNNGDSTDEARKKALEFVYSQTVRGDNLKSRANDLYMDYLNVVTEYVGKKNDVQFYAEKLNVSTRYLAQVTRQIANKSPKMIIDEKLIKKIELLLKTTEKNVQEIANECGFSSQAHLANFFKKLRGVSPTGYRKKY